MRKDIKTNKVVKALAIGLAASMAMSQPISVMAEEAPVEPNEGGEGTAVVETKENTVVATESATAAQADLAVANGVLEGNTEDLGLVEDIETNVKDTDGLSDDTFNAVQDAADAVTPADAQQNVVEDASSALETVKGDVADVVETEKAADDALSNVATELGESSLAMGELGDAVEDMKDLAEEGEKIAEDIAAAGSIADATELKNEYAEKIEAATVAYDEKLAAYDAAKLEYDAAKAALEDAELAYNEALNAANGSVEDAQTKLDAAKAVAEGLEAALEAAKAEVDASVADALALEEEMSDAIDGTWPDKDELFKKLVANYVVSENGSAVASVVREQGVDNDSYNYFTVTYEDGTVEYFNYKVSDDKKELVIFEKREIETRTDLTYDEAEIFVVFGSDGKVVESHTKAEIEEMIKAGTIIAVEAEDGEDTTCVYVKAEFADKEATADVTAAKDADGHDTVIIGADEKTVTYELTKEGNLVKKVSKDVTTIVYENATFNSGDTLYETEQAAKDAATAATKEGMVEGTTATVTTGTTQVDQATYTATGTYIPTFTKTITISERVDTWDIGDGTSFDIWSDSKSDAINYIKEEYTEEYEDEDKYANVKIVANLNAREDDKDRDGWLAPDDDGYYVTGTITVTYNKVVKSSVDFDLWEDIKSFFGADDKEEAEAAAKAAVEAQGGQLLDFESWNWNTQTAQIRYIEGATVTGDACDSVDEAKANVQAKIAEISGAKNVKVSDAVTEGTKKVTKYTYTGSYKKIASTTTEEKIVTTTTWTPAEVQTLVASAVQNQKYLDKEFMTEVNDAAAADIERAHELSDKYAALYEDAQAAAKAVADAQADVDALSKALAEMQAKDSYYDDENNAQDLASLEKALADAYSELSEQEELLEELEDKLADAEEELAKTIDRLTPDPVDDDDDDDEEEVVVETPVVVAEPAPVAVQTVVAVEPTVEEPVVEITENEVPLAEEIEETKEEVQEEAPVVIEEEDVPLAAAPVDAEDGMSWWWLLVVVLLGATGAEMYRRHKNKKAEAMEKKSDK